MHWCKRIFGATVAALSLVFLVLCVGGIAGAWIVRGRAIPAVAEAGTSAVETLTSANNAVDQFQQKVAKVRTVVAVIEEETRRLAALGPEDIAAVALIQRYEQVVEQLKPAQAVAASLQMVVAVLDRGLARWQPARAHQLEIDRLRDAIRRLAEIATALEQAKKGLVEQTPAAAARFAEELRQVDIRLKEIEESLQDFAVDLGETKTAVAELAEAMPQWLTTAAWAASLVLSWFAFSQVSLLLHGWSLVRNGRPAESPRLRMGLPGLVSR
jgi:hypothetical protein